VLGAIRLAISIVGIFLNRPKVNHHPMANELMLSVGGEHEIVAVSLSPGHPRPDLVSLCSRLLGDSSKAAIGPRDPGTLFRSSTRSTYEDLDQLKVNFRQDSSAMTLNEKPDASRLRLAPMPAR